MEKKVVELNLEDVLPNRFQPRIKFSEESIQELANSIKEHGVIQPIVVRNLGGKYEIIAGERRYKASLLAGKQTISAIITDLSEEDSAEVALIENVQRKDLTPIEEAISYKKILDMGYLTQDTLAAKLGKNQSTIANKLRLLNLDDDVQEALLNEKISERHARSLLRLTNLEKQREVLNRIINERLTVRKTDEVIDNMMNDNVEKLNFGETITPKSNQEFEVFNPDIEVFNIPTAPILQDSIPDTLPTEQLKIETPIFNPSPEIIESTVPPVPESFFEEPKEEVSIPEFNQVIEPPLPNLENSNINNPGFMNIDKIEQESNNIFTEKPLAPVENLLKPDLTEQPVMPVNNVIEEKETAEDILVPGKFFNLMNEEETPNKIEENYNFDINSFNNVEDLPSINNIEPKIETIEEQPLLNPLNNDLYVPENPIPLANDVNPNLDTIAELTIPNSLKEIDEFDTIEEPNSIPSLVNEPARLELKDAIKMARDFEQQLARNGFIVDIDEFDFEDMYQIVFKINK